MFKFLILIVTIIVYTSMTVMVMASDSNTLLTKDEVSKLTSKQLRRMLQDRNLDCRGCAEKQDFIDKVYKHVSHIITWMSPHFVPHVSFL